MRIPLGGRRVRGFVTSVSEGAPSRPLKPIAARSGQLPVFDTGLLQSIRWAAAHYVAPLAGVLRRATPPNLPKPRKPRARSSVPNRSGRLAKWGAAQIVGGHSPPRYVVTGERYAAPIADAIAPILESGRNTMVAIPTAAEAEAVAGDLRDAFGDRILLVTAPMSAAEHTKAWSTAAQGGGFALVGTREIALWPGGDLGGAVIVEEGRRAFKSPSTPTMHVRDVLRRRAAVERFGLLFLGSVPTTEVLAAGVTQDVPAGRVWPLVEVVDRSEEPPGSGLVMDRTRAAIGAAVRSGGRVFVLVSRRGYASAFRCVGCREVRRCVQCGAALDRGGPCPRCGTKAGPCPKCGGSRFEPLGAGIGRVVDDLRRSFGASVTPAGEGGTVTVGTERDLVSVSGLDLAVAVDGDGPILAPHYRAEEDALRLFARLALTVRRGRGKRCMIQTGDPRQRVIEALRSGRPFPILEQILGERADSSFPPVGDIIAVEVAGLDDSAPLDGDAILRQTAAEATILGPAPGPAGSRWLIQGADLRRTRILLRPAVQTLRDAGAKVRVDVDPIDL